MSLGGNVEGRRYIQITFYCLLSRGFRILSRMQIATSPTKTRSLYFFTPFQRDPVENIDIKKIYVFVEEKASEGKFAMVNPFRSLRSDIFTSAMAVALA